MTRLRVTALATVLTIGLPGCIEINLPEEIDLFAAGPPFVVRGTAVLLDNDGPCLAWVGENGVTYHLFQGRRLSNEEFDRVSTPGVTSRLVLSTRKDLKLDCRTGTIVDVDEVLEIVDAE
ncbi:MAG: hypothetical protein ACYTFA_10615 [Planctomycetota bacterium]